MKFKVKKEELERNYLSCSGCKTLGCVIKDEIELEGEPVIKYYSHNCEKTCNKERPKKIEKIMFAFDGKNDFNAIITLRDKINEIIKHINEVNT